MKISKISLLHVHHMPKQLEPGILYVAQEFGSAAHLCACGCGMKVRTPLSRWSLAEDKNGPSLWPSVGNWQQPCKSHYIIEDGEILWCGEWTPEQILAGRRNEKARREERHAEFYAERSWSRRAWKWIKSIFAK